MRDRCMIDIRHCAHSLTSGDVILELSVIKAKGGRRSPDLLPITISATEHPCQDPREDRESGGRGRRVKIPEASSPGFAY